MLIGIQDEILRMHALGLLKPLLADKSTHGAIVWATDAYAEYGPQYQSGREILPHLITGRHSGVIKNHARRNLEQQCKRTRRHGEVSTPLRICRMMNDRADEAWRDACAPSAREPWQRYVDSRRLEIACGEAPFLASRYDVSTGEIIHPTERTGVLDRKLRLVNEHARTREEWLFWAQRAFQATYGYELQGDNLLIARMNLLLSFEEYFAGRWKGRPSCRECRGIANIIAWNIWQMDGTTCAIPPRRAGRARQLSLLESARPRARGRVLRQLSLIECAPAARPVPAPERRPCVVFNWRTRRSMEFSHTGRPGTMKFDFIIGNPPYQEEVENNGRKNPIYHMFMDESYKIGDVVELITPARFLFNAGQTPKEWNRKMLADPHLKVLWYEQDSSKVFSNTDIKGGIAITYHDSTQDFGAIEVFSHFWELNSILKKVNYDSSLASIIVGAVPYRFSECLRDAHPECVELLGASFDLRTNVFDRLQDIVFFDKKPEDDEYIKIIGRYKKKRAEKWIARKYVLVPENFEFYKVLVPESNGSGAIGEVMSTPLIGQPLIGHTQTFISIGCFQTEAEAQALLKYVKTKFCRVMLGILKITQHNPPATWKYVPMQDFTPNSDVDWSLPVPEIDRRLYAKYGLDEKEIAFIETHVKEME